MIVYPSIGKLDSFTNNKINTGNTTNPVLVKYFTYLLNRVFVKALSCCGVMVSGVILTSSYDLRNTLRSFEISLGETAEPSGLVLVGLNRPSSFMIKVMPGGCNYFTIQI